MALKGLVLCGGKSLRMQQDKSTISYHGLPQWQYLYNLLKEFVPEVWLSAREGQEFPGCGNIIHDSVEGAGPSAGLLSAYAHDPAASWLVLACDLPLISAQSISLLLEKRQPRLAATSFISPFNEQPEPLIAIWEPAALEQLANDFREGKTCPRKTLSGMEVALIENPYRREQYNANTPEEMENAKEKLK
ncbi:molybdenum cofactor guanylyltransferase [Chitinophaga barathri]|nr:NTP transferase domain-containing protein [Chitinophaga barathri]